MVICYTTFIVIEPLCSKLCEGKFDDMDDNKKHLNAVLMIVLGLVMLGVWISFMAQAFENPFPFIVAGLAVLLLIAKNVNNLFFHMVGVTLFAIFLIYIDKFKEFPLRYTVLGLIFIVLTARDSSGQRVSFYREWKRRKDEKKNKNRSD